jgi:large subunit ribosomal protein L4|uniref:Large ribosomal subunit protein uL4 n=1 Tax=candidate division WOR-3 bacterium TaxID=2052148 RepID=A0A7V3UZ92_UNCW3
MDVLKLTGEVKKTVELPEDWFNREGPASLLWEAVRCYLANQRQGTAKTKTRAEVSGTGKKPWPQKHTGRARHGSRRSPIWVKGGIAWGPKPRDYSYELPKKVRRYALALALTVRNRENSIKLIEDFELSEPKTRELVKIFKGLGMVDNVLLLVPTVSENLRRASANLQWLDVMPAAQLNTYAVLTHNLVVFTESGLHEFLDKVAKVDEKVKTGV